VQILVLAVVHNPVLLAGISALIETQPALRSVGTAQSVESGLALYSKSSPDITLIDLNLPGTGALQAIGAIRNLNPAARVIGLTTYELEPICMKAVEVGAASILPKHQISDHLVDLIHELFRGRDAS
jgi:DNA-binding NarL/FixJ family response regulator